MPYRKTQISVADHSGTSFIQAYNEIYRYIMERIQTEPSVYVEAMERRTVDFENMMYGVTRDSRVSNEKWNIFMRYADITFTKELNDAQKIKYNEIPDWAVEHATNTINIELSITRRNSRAHRLTDYS